MSEPAVLSGARTIARTAPIIVLALACGYSASAITKTWDGGAGTTNWNAPENWSPDGLPGPNDDVVIPLPSFSVAHSSGTNTVKSISCAGTLQMLGGALTITNGGTISGAAHFSSGTLASTGTIVLDCPATWAGATLNVATLRVNPGRILAINGTSTFSGTLQNQGNVNWTAGDLIVNGGTFDNQSQLTVNSAGTLSIAGGCCGFNTAFLNTGTISITGGGTFALANFGSDLVFTSNGSIAVDAGKFQPVTTSVINGPLSIAPGAQLLHNNGTLTIGASANVSNTGAIVQQGGTLTIDCAFPATMPVSHSGGTLILNVDHVFQVPLQVTSGSLGGAGAFTIKSASTMTNSSITSGGALTVASDGTLAISTLTIARPLINQGLIDLQSGDLLLNGATFTNNSEFRLSAAGTQNIAGGCCGFTNAFVNNGTVRRTATGSFNLSNFGSDLPVSGNGAWIIESGEWHPNTTATLSGAVTMANGTKLIHDNGSLNFDGAATLSATSWTLQQSGSTAQLNVAIPTTARLVTTGGTLTCAVNQTLVDANITTSSINGAGQLVLQGATSITNSTMAVGSLSIPINATLTMSGVTLACNLTNEGTVDWNGGDISLNSSNVVNNGTWLASATGTHTLAGGCCGFSNSFANIGTFRRTAAGALFLSNFGSDVIVTSPGTWIIEQGEFHPNLSATFSGSLEFAAGTKLVHEAATLTIAASATLSATAWTFQQTGGQANIGIALPLSVNVTGTGGTLNLLAPQTLIGCAFSSTSIIGGAPLTLQGSCSITNLALGSGGSLIVAPGATLTTSGLALGRDLVNNGVVKWLNGDISLQNATITNNGEIDLPQAGNSTMAGGCCGFTNAFLNAGTLRKQASGKVSFLNFGSLIAISGGGSWIIEQGELEIAVPTTVSGALSMADGTKLTHTAQTCELAASAAIDATAWTLSQSGGQIDLAMALPTTVTVTHSGGTVNAIADQTFVNWTTTSGTITGAGDIELQGASLITTATLSGAGSTHVADGAVLQLSGLVLARELINDGAINWPAGDISITGATFVNHGDFVDSASGSHTMAGGCCGFTNTFVNDGAIHKIGAGTLNLSNFGSLIDVTLNGTCIVEQGELHTTVPVTINGALDMHDGTVYSTDGSTTNFAATATLSADAWTLRATGGTTTLGATLPTTARITTTGGTFAFAIDQTLVNASFANSTVNGSGSIALLGASNITSTTISGSGLIDIPSGATTTLGGTTFSRNLTNHGTVNWTTVDIVLIGSTFTNAGEFNIAVPNNQNLAGGCCGFTNSFINTGIVRKQNASTVGIANFGSALPFDNQGAVQIEAGQLNFGSGNLVNLSGTTLTGGTWLVQGALGLPSNLNTLAADLTLDGASATIVNTGNSTSAIASLSSIANGATLELANARDLAITPGGGTLTSAGTLKTGPSSQLTLSGSFQQTPSGLLHVICDTTDAALVATSNDSLDGTLKLNFDPSFAPVAGTAFDLVSGATVSGQFAALNVPSNVSVTYAPTAVHIDVGKTTPTPDLVVASITSTGPFSAGEPIAIAFNETNIGVASAEGTWNDVADLLSSPDSLTPLVTFGPIVVQGPLAPQRAAPRAIDATLPFVDGTFNFAIRLDTASDLDEGGGGAESNNRTVSGAIQIHAANLKPAAAVTPSSLTTTVASNITMVTTNAGLGASYGPCFTNKLFLSADDILDAGDLEIATAIHCDAPIDAGGSASAVVAVTLPESVVPGIYRLIEQVDVSSQRFETNEVDNVAVVAQVDVLPAPRPNLKVIAVSLPPTASIGSTFTMQWTVQNVGLLPATGSWIDKAVLSADATFGGDIALEPGATTVGPLAPNASATISRTYLVPQTPGSYVAFVVTDASGGVDEGALGENDNISAASAAMAVDFAPSADLVVLSVNTPSSGNGGDAIAIDCVLRNQGEVEATGPWHDVLYLSVDRGLSADDISLGDFLRNGSIPAGGEASFPANVVLPSDINGPRFVIVKIDVLDSVEEQDGENNNVGVSTSAIDIAEPAHPDLVITSVVAPISVETSAPITITWDGSNQGALPTGGGWVDRVYLSSDAIFDGGDALVATRPQSAVIAGGTWSGNATFNAPPTSGPRFALVVADAADAIEEGTADNNNASASPSAIDINNPPKPNLVAAITSVPTTAIFGDAAQISWTVTNDGLSTAQGPWSDQVWLSIDATLSIDDLLLKTQPFAGALAQGASYSRTTAVQLPESFVAGTRHFIVVNDSTGKVDELDETDNIVASGDVPIEATPAPNLTCTNVALGASSATFGQTLSIDWNGSNIGTLASSALWTDTIFLSTDAALSSDDVPIAALAHNGALAVGASYAGHVEPTLPISNALPDGTYRVLVRLDGAGAITEPDENDNVHASAPIQIVRPPLANLVVAMNGLPALVTSGVPFDVDFVFTNTGPAQLTGNFSTRLQIPAPDGALIQLQEFVTSGPIDPSASKIVTRTVTLPPIPGATTTLVVCADSHDDIVEIDELNCIEATLALSRPDLVPVSVTGPTSAQAGDTVAFTITARNDGNVPAAGLWVDSLSLSADGTLGADRFLASVNQNGPLAPGDSITRNVIVELPEDLEGTYLPVLVVDATNLVFESVEGGANALLAVGSPIAVTPGPRPNLTIDSVALSTNAVAAGGKFTVTWTVSNHGAGNADLAWVDAVYASLNGVLTDIDPHIGQFLEANPLPAGESRVVAIEVIAPAIPGDWHIFVKADDLNTILEAPGTENDNAMMALPAIAVAPVTVAISSQFSEMPVGEAIPIVGSAHVEGTPQPVAGVNVKVRAIVRGFPIETTATTLADGSFSIDFQTPSGIAGLYSFTAGIASGPQSPPQFEVAVWGVSVALDKSSVQIIPGGGATGSFTIKNLGDLPVTGLSFAITSDDPAVTGNPTLAATSLGSLESKTGTWSIAASSESPVGGTATLTAQSDQAQPTSAQLGVQIVPALPTLVATPSNVNRPMQVGTQSFIDVTITNTGFAPTNALKAQLAPAAFLTLVSPSELPGLAPGESAVVSIRVAPAEDLPLGPYVASPGLVVFDIEDPAISVAVNLTLEATSDAIGSLTVHCTDEFSFYGVPPTFPQATIELRPINETEIIASGTADETGTLEFTRLPAGIYHLKATVPEHNPVEGDIEVAGPGVEQAVFLSRQLVSYTFSVVPIDFQDQYLIQLQLSFQTNVPAPVVIPDPPQLDYFAMTQEVEYREIKLTNYGLVGAQAFKWTIENSARFEAIPLSPEVGDIGPGQSIICPFLIVDHALASGNTNDFQGCLNVLIAGVYQLVCGPNINQYGVPIGGQLPPQAGCGFPSLPSFLGGFGGGGGFTLPGGGPIGPTFSGPVQGIVTNICAGAPPSGGGGPDAPIGNPCTTICLDQLKLGQGALPPASGCSIALAKSALNSVALSKVLVAAYSPCIPLKADLCTGRAGATGCDCIANPLDFCDPDAISKGLDPFADWEAVDLNNAGLEYYERSLFRLWSSVRPAVYMLGDVAWIDSAPEDSELLATLVLTIADFASVNSLEGERISSEEASVLITMPAPESLTPDRVTKALERWNRTLDYHALGIFELSDVPDGLSTDFVVASALAAYQASAGEAFDDMQAAGFVGVADEAHAALDVVIDDLSSSGQAFCVAIQLELDQQLTLTRQAFEATMTLNNATPTPVQALSVELVIKDVNGDDQSSKFLILTPTLDNLDAIDGSGQLAPSSSGSATFVIIPGDSAAPTIPTDYFVSGTLSYALGTQVVALPLFPAHILVTPNPSLDLQYFIETKVFGDDPFTPELEPSVPFNLGLWAKNGGGGVAKSVQIISAQPQILDTQRDILIDFQLIGSQVAGQDVTPSLAVSLGDIEPDSVAVARWLMICSLQGEFIDYDATIESLNGFDDPEFAVVDNAEVSALTHAVRADDPIDDGISDFLADKFPDLDDLPDRVYLSSGAVEPVTGAIGGSLEQVGALTFTLTVPATPGWHYSRITDPFGGSHTLASVTRSDGKQIRLDDNVWLTSYIDRTGPTPVDRRDVHLFDRAGDGVYTLVFNADTTEPKVTSWASARQHGALGEFGISIEAGKPTSEPRVGGLSKLVASFSEPVDPATATSASVAITAYDAFGNEMDLTNTHLLSLTLGNQFANIVFTPALPDNLRYCIRLVGVEDLSGNVLVANTARIDIAGALGDATGDQRVNVTDAGAVVSLMGTVPIDPTNPFHLRADLNHDGAINANDLMIVLSHIGTDLRFAPNPCTGFPQGDTIANGGGAGGLDSNSMSDVDSGVAPPIAMASSAAPSAPIKKTARKQGTGASAVIGNHVLGPTVLLKDDNESLRVRVRYDLFAARAPRELAEFDADVADLLASYAVDVDTARDVGDGWQLVATPSIFTTTVAITALERMLVAAGLEIGVVVEREDGTLLVVEPVVRVAFRGFAPVEWRERVLERELFDADIELPELPHLDDAMYRATLASRFGGDALDCAARLARRSDVRVAVPLLHEIRDGADETNDESVDPVE